ncbi:zinc finger, CCHC-type, retrotransposon gag domain protein [Tanacetum coccineum]
MHEENQQQEPIEIHIEEIQEDKALGLDMEIEDNEIKGNIGTDWKNVTEKLEITERACDEARQERDATHQELFEVQKRLARLIRAVIPTILEEQCNESSIRTPMMEKHGSYKDFISVNPPEFYGEADPIKSTNWVKAMEDVHEIIGCAEGEENVKNMTWGFFKAYFLEKYCPQSLLDVLEERFMHLTQGWLTVTEYANKFTELSRFAKYLVATEIIKAKRFVAGLSPTIRGPVAMTMSSTYREAVEVTLLAEREYGRKKDENKREKCK